MSPLQRPDALIPRFLWRVESTKSRRRVLESSYWASQDVHCTRDELRSYISAHMTGRYALYHAPFIITSLTGSLLWALNYAHWLLSLGEREINIVLLDAWSALTDEMTEHIYPAKYLAAWLKIPPLGKPWHDDPYHEYFVFGDFPLDAVLGSAELRDADGPNLNTLLPGFSEVDRRESLHESLSRFQAGNPCDIFLTPAKPVTVTNDDLRAAFVIASNFLNFLSTPDPDIRFQLAMMFLALRSRDWNQPGVWPAVRDVFQGVHVPGLYLYKVPAVPIDQQMPDVVRWVRGMEAIRFECIIARVQAERHVQRENADAKRTRAK